MKKAVKITIIYPILIISIFIISMSLLHIYNEYNKQKIVDSIASALKQNGQILTKNEIQGIKNNIVIEPEPIKFGSIKVYNTNFYSMIKKLKNI